MQSEKVQIQVNISSMDRDLKSTAVVVLLTLMIALAFTMGPAFVTFLYFCVTLSCIVGYTMYPDKCDNFLRDKQLHLLGASVGFFTAGPVGLLLGAWIVHFSLQKLNFTTQKLIVTPIHYVKNFFTTTKDFTADLFDFAKTTMDAMHGVYDDDDDDDDDDENDDDNDNEKKRTSPVDIASSTTPTASEDAKKEPENATQLAPTKDNTTPTRFNPLKTLSNFLDAWGTTMDAMHGVYDDDDDDDEAERPVSEETAKNKADARTPAQAINATQNQSRLITWSYPHCPKVSPAIPVPFEEPMANKINNESKIQKRL